MALNSKLMKNIILLSILLFSISSFTNAQIKDIGELEKKGTIYYSEGKPYTGGCFGKHDNGQIGLKGKIVEGKKEGKWTWWYSSGQKKRESEFTNNRKHGLTVYWYENGVKAKEIIYREGKNIDQKLWYEDGSRKPNPSFNQTK